MVADVDDTVRMAKEAWTAVAKRAGFKKSSS